jgi:outer membrane protein OmpA-like peptidoglycan-associated protein
MKGKFIARICGMGILFLVSGCLISQAQIKVDVKKKVNQQANQRANQRTNQAIDKTFDKVEEGVGSIFKKKENSKSTGSTQETAQVIKTAPTQEGQYTTPQDQVEVGGTPQPQLTWSKYDFVPGTEIIFEDDFKGELNGEFPSRWDITKGTVEMAQFGDDMVVYFRKTNANVPEAILPLLTNRKEDYLPEEFTIEFDCYFYDKKLDNYTYYLFLYDVKNQMKILSPSKPIRVDFNQVTYDHAGDLYPGQNAMKPIAGWRHVAISFNKRALKCYLDDTRLVNIPNIEFNPTGVMLSAGNVAGKGKPFIKNVRIAKGAVPLYDKFLVNGKFVTTGIRFDVNKATIKSESMGTINYVVKMMTDHPELKFSVEGHTDSDGENVANQKLSEARSKSVMNVMVNLGISADRLTSKGLGESKPMTGNDTPEGKAQNRRVEFVKF